MHRKGTTILAIIAVVLTLGVLWYSNRPVISREPTWEEVQAQARSGGYRLINTQELATLYRQDPTKGVPGGHAARLGVPHRPHPGIREFFHGAHRLGALALPGAHGQVPGA